MEKVGLDCVCRTFPADLHLKYDADFSGRMSLQGAGNGVGFTSFCWWLETAGVAGQDLHLREDSPDII